MGKLLIALFHFFFFWSIEATWIKATPGKQVDLGPYDSLVTWKNTTFIVSGHPCETGRTFSLSIIRIKHDPLFMHHEFIKKGWQVVQIDDSLAVSFEFQPKEHESKNHFFLRMKQVIINETTGEKSFLPGFMMDLYWKLDQKKCLENSGLMTDRSKYKFLEQRACTHSLRHGDFSTICHQSKKALYMTILNICDVPYSINVVSMLTDGEISVHKFTKDKDDSTPIQIVHTKEQHGSCGLLVTFHGHVKNHEKQHAQLKYVCSNTTLGENVTLIDDSYYTVYGMLCELTNCNRSLVESHVCKQKIYNGAGQQVNAVFILSLDVCDKRNIIGKLNMKVDGFPKTFKTTLKATVELLDNSKRKILDLGTDLSQRKQHLHNGFEQIDGGEISLYVTQNKLKNIFHVTLLRHFPNYFDRYPLLHDDFIIDKAEVCVGRNKKVIQNRGTSPSGIRPWSIILIVACCILVIIGIVMLARWWRGRHLYSSELGLPYHIELDDDDFSIDSENFKG